MSTKNNDNKMSDTNSTNNNNNNNTSTGKVSVLTEGTARIPYTGDEGVFYNKVQIFNRDISILAIRVFSMQEKKSFEEKEAKRLAKIQTKSTNNNNNDSNNAKSTQNKSSKSSNDMNDNNNNTNNNTNVATTFPGIRIFEALSATGLRSIRYHNEIPHVSSIIVNDLDPLAVEQIRKNIQFNNISTDKLIPSQGDATIVMVNQRLKPDNLFDVVDLDPYGSASEFLDSAVQAVRDGGLLIVTCTDKAVLCGNYGEVSYAKYGGYSIRAKYCHEQAVRILLGAIQTTANKYKRYIQPVLSMSIDFYVRVFVRVHVSPAKVKLSACSMGLVYNCNGCESYYSSPIGKVKTNGNSVHYNANTNKVPINCTQCNSEFQIAGPMYIDTMHDVEFVKQMLNIVKNEQDKFATAQRIIGSLTVIESELPNIPLYYTLSGICATLHVKQPKISLIRSAIMNAGYLVSQAHSCADAIKTNAPNNIIWDIMRGYAKLNPFNDKNVKPNSPARIILSKKANFEPDFTFVEGADLSTKATGVGKFLPNPEANWGPKARAVKRKDRDEDNNNNNSDNSNNETKNDSNTDTNDKKDINPADLAGIEIERRSKANQNKRFRTKKRPCEKYFRTGLCKFAENCKFSHSKEDFPDWKPSNLKKKSQRDDDENETNDTNNNTDNGNIDSTNNDLTMKT